jgi:hypothetical protein
MVAVNFDRHNSVTLTSCLLVFITPRTTLFRKKYCRLLTPLQVKLKLNVNPAPSCCGADGLPSALPSAASTAGSATHCFMFLFLLLTLVCWLLWPATVHSFPQVTSWQQLRCWSWPAAAAATSLQAAAIMSTPRCQISCCTASDSSACRHVSYGDVLPFCCDKFQ